MGALTSRENRHPSGPALVFPRAEWTALGDGTLPPLPDAELATQGGLTERASREDMADGHMLLARLLGLHVGTARGLRGAQGALLGRQAPAVQFIIGVAGRVAVGQSTLARLLRAVLSRPPGSPKVDLVTTDGFLHPTRMLEERGLPRHKGSRRATTAAGCCPSDGQGRGPEPAHAALFARDLRRGAGMISRTGLTPCSSKA